MFSFSPPKNSHPLIFEIQKLLATPGDIDEDEIKAYLGKLRDEDDFAFGRLMQLEPDLQTFANSLPPARISVLRDEESRSNPGRTSPGTPRMQEYLSINADGNPVIQSPGRMASFGSLLSLQDTGLGGDEGLHIEEVFEHLDKSGKGSINRDQFIQGIRELRRKKMARSSSKTKRKSMDLQAWVHAHKGTHVINRLLIANNGLAAVKAIMSIREWAQDNFQQSHIISIVCMATKEDIKSNSEFIRMSDELIEVPGGTNANNYANIQVIVTTALRAHCDAVWAGWGHASENPELPRALLENGLLWLGPGAEAMETLGDKIRSTLIAQNCGVQVFPWSGDGIKGWGQTEFAEACVTTVQGAAKAAERIGFPIMIKASEGGGGKGIRMCEHVHQVNDAFRQVSSEVPGSPIFIMKLGNDVRHVEVQLVADNYGNTIAVYGRDCSIQRRHQKIIEEGPALSKDSKTMKAMMTAAISLAKQVGYVGLGTVEYLYFKNGTYCFLELNPRLQVEHGVSELLSGVNLPACQVMIAMGIPLFCIKEIRQLFGKDKNGTDPIDFPNCPMVPTKSFVIACRITAENAGKGFQPTTGKIEELILRPRAQTFGYFSMKPGSAVHEFADSQFGHVFAVGKTREIARVRMLNTLRHLDVRGEISTNIEFLQFVLETPDFKKNRITTEWLEKLTWKKDMKKEVVILLGCAVSAHESFHNERASAVEDVKRGRSLIGHSMDRLAIADVSLIWKGTKYTFIAERVSELKYNLRLQSKNANGWKSAIEIRSLSDGGFLISIDSHTYVVYRDFKTTGLQVLVNGVEYCFENEYDPSVLKASMSGKMVKLLVKNGDHVEKNQAYAEIEVMKMILQLKAPESGTVELKVFEGSVLEPGTLIANLTLDDPDKIRRTEIFEGRFTEMGLPHAPTNKPQELFFDSMKAVHDMMKGYNFTTDRKEIVNMIETMVNCLRDPMMPAHEFVDTLESIKDRVPDSLYKKLTVVGQDYISVAVRRTKSSLFPWEKPAVFPVNEVRAAIEAQYDVLDAEESLEFEKIVMPIREMLMKWQGGAGSYLKNQFLELLGMFCECEKYFCGFSNEESMSRLMADIDDTETIVDMLFAHSRLEYRVPLVLEILGMVGNIFEERLLQYNSQISPMLEKLMQLTDTPYAQVHIKTRSIKMQQSVATKYERWMSLEQAIRNKNMDNSNIELHNLFEFFPGFMADSDQTLSRNAVEIFLDMLWRRHFVENIKFIEHEDHALYDTTIRYKLVPRPTSKYSQAVNNISGIMAISYDIASCLNNMESIIQSLKGEESKTLFFLIYLEPPKRVPGDDKCIALIRGIIKNHVEHLKETNVSEIMVLVCLSGKDNEERLHHFYRFNKDADYDEDALRRHICPPIAETFELDRFKDVEVKNVIRDENVFIYEATGSQLTKRIGSTWLFARNHISPRDERVTYTSMLGIANDIPKVIYQYELALFETLIAIEKVLEGDRNNYLQNHILLVYEYNMDSNATVNSLEKFAGQHFEMAIKTALQEVTKIYYRRYYQALDQCNVTRIELVCKANNTTAPPPVLRIVLDIPYRRCMQMYPYLEVISGSDRSFISLSEQGGPYNGIKVDASLSGPLHLVKDELTAKRIFVKKNSSVYAYDWIALFRQALSKVWNDMGREDMSTKCVIAKELVVEDGELVEIEREIGQNDIGMVAWLVTMYTPEYEQGREIVVVSNELSVNIGTFGVAEDTLFLMSSKLARSKGIPFVYMSCNSGARIGLAKELMHRFKIAWIKDEDEEMPKGADYLYLTPEDYDELSEYVVCNEIEVNGEKQFKLEAIIGKDDGLGVENLSGSGMIAGELSGAYDEIMTLTYVSGRSVGIGAYLVRLGQRVIQKSGSPILLTGYQALNNLLRKQVYLSNVQLGGLGIMCPNGVSHVAVQDDLGGIEQIIKWISYLPRTKFEVQMPAITHTDKSDPIDRDVTYTPQDQEDIKFMINGREVEGEFESGCFDKGSFTETLSQWAKGIVVGRARLGGIPVGVIVVNTETTTKIIPPDPANLESNESKMQQAGKVWYPDSSYKTANTIKDMNREGLPLMMFANMRGFSGGASDMFNEVLKFGSYIVDALREYRQPVTVYIPPKGEIRGGAWVVLDTLINPDFIEMYASESARGGVLEANATAALKFRGANLNALMNRTDEVLIDLAKQEQTTAVKQAMKKRQTFLRGLYRGATVEFADLHDRPQRMLAKNAVRDMVPWVNSRRYFYWRLRRNLHIQRIFNRMKNDACMSDVKSRFDAVIQKHLPDTHNNDEAVARWCDNNAAALEEISDELLMTVVGEQIQALAKLYPGNIQELIQKMGNAI